MANIEEQRHPTGTARGAILHETRFYDLLAWVVTRGKETVFREKIVELARINSGESVLDVGCGTGTLAIAAKRRVGPNGKVAAIDASPEMIKRAIKKAKKEGLDIAFANQSIETLAFPDKHFDVVLSTLMLHHLPRKVRELGLREIIRVLKPNGRVLIVDFGGTQPQRGLLPHLHRRHGHVKQTDVVALLEGAGLRVVESGRMNVSDLHFTLATIRSCES